MRQFRRCDGKRGTNLLAICIIVTGTFIHCLTSRHEESYSVSRKCYVHEKRRVQPNRTQNGKTESEIFGNPGSGIHPIYLDRVCSVSCGSAELQYNKVLMDMLKRHHFSDFDIISTFRILSP